MEKHPKTIEGYVGSIEDLAKSVGNLSYDQTSLFIKKLAEDIVRQADADMKKNKTKHATELYLVADKLYDAKDKIDLAWKICKPYMKD